MPRLLQINLYPLVFPWLLTTLIRHYALDLFDVAVQVRCQIIYETKLFAHQMKLVTITHKNTGARE